jgi:transcriptional regulator with XRE-family HTH domain
MDMHRSMRNSRCMSEQPRSGVDLEFDLADRMRKALRVANVGVAEMADYLGVARTSVGNWINGRVRPGTQTLRLWSLRCGVPYEWLVEGECAVRDLNPEPAGLVHLARVIASETEGFTDAMVLPFMPHKIRRPGDWWSATHRARHRTNTPERVHLAMAR